MLTPGVRLVERLGALHFVDGRRVVSLQADATTCAAIRAAVHSTVPPAASTDPEIRQLLAELGLLDAGAPAPGDGDATVSYASASAGGRVDFAEAERRLDRVTVHVLGDFGDDNELLVDELTGSGLRCDDLDDLDDIAGLDPRRDVVVVVADPQRPAARLRAANAACVAAGITWFPVSAYDGAVLRVGPLIVPGATACYECTERRLAANAEYSEIYREVVADAPAAPAPRAVQSWAAALVALSLLAWLVAADARVPGRLLTIAPTELAVRSAIVYRVPRCPACSAPDHLHAAAPWAIARDH